MKKIRSNFSSECRTNDQKHINNNSVTNKGEILFMKATKKTNTNLPVTTNVTTDSSI